MTVRKPCRPTCNCPANSPFLWEQNRPEHSFAAEFQKGLIRSIKTTSYVEERRAEGHDIGHIAGLTEKVAPERGRPQRFVTETAA